MYDKKAERARQLFKEGYNCAQAVVGAFAKEMGMDFDTAMKLASSFGGGMGRMREVCGAVSGMFIVAGVLYGYSDPKDKDAKDKHYALIQELAEKFKNQNGSIVCKNLLTGKNLEFGHNKIKSLEDFSDKEKREIDTTPVSTPRTAEFYKKRPCAELVRCAANIMNDVILRNENIDGRGERFR